MKCFEFGKRKDSGYPFTYKVFADLGHGGLAGEHTARFAEEVKAAHARSLSGLKNQMFSEGGTKK